MVENIYIHVGYPKCASTTLQKHPFNKHSEINYLGLYPTSNLGKDTDEIDDDNSYLNEPKLRDFYSKIINYEGIEYEYSVDEESLKKYISSLLSEDTVNLFSHEALTDSFSADRSLKAKRLKNIFPSAKIMIIIRKQEDLARSQYDDWPFDPRGFEVGEPMDIDKWMEIHFNNPKIGFLNSLNYHRTAKYYADLFGKENVGIFLFEELVEDLDSFAKKISKFMGVNPDETIKYLADKHENKSMASRYKKYRMLTRKMFGDDPMKKVLPEEHHERFKEFLNKGKTKKAEMSDYWKKKIRDRYRESNMKLSDHFSLSLGKYNYSK